MQFSLWRILGNDLPPRHKVGQTRENLLFILENEPELERCTRHWIVNRVVDSHEEEQLLTTLDRYSQPHVHIPFCLDEYHRCEEVDLDTYPLVNELASIADRRRHSQCLYVMHLNAARNLAIEEGRLTAHWVLPLDGNCCFTKDGWERIVDGLAQQDDLRRCFAVPMYRVKGNAEYHGFSVSGREANEPQVIIGRDAEARFDPLYRYGRDSKIELLERLEFADRKGATHEMIPPEDGLGYVMRLFSGVPQGEGHWTRRAGLREQGIDLLLERIDRMTAAEAQDFTPEKRS